MVNDCSGVLRLRINTDESVLIMLILRRSGITSCATKENAPGRLLLATQLS